MGGEPLGVIVGRLANLGVNALVLALWAGLKHEDRALSPGLVTKSGSRPISTPAGRCGPWPTGSMMRSRKASLRPPPTSRPRLPTLYRGRGRNVAVSYVVRRTPSRLACASSSTPGRVLAPDPARVSDPRARVRAPGRSCARKARVSRPVDHCPVYQETLFPCRAARPPWPTAGDPAATARRRGCRGRARDGRSAGPGRRDRMGPRVVPWLK